MAMRSKVLQTGVSLIEVIVGVGIITVMLVVIGFSITSYIDARAALLDNTKAMYLAEEGYEILRAVRDNNWETIDELSTNTYYYFYVSTSTFATSTTPEIIDAEFRRSFMLRELRRDANDDIVASGGTVDSESRLVEVFVGTTNGTTSLEFILTNIFAI
jgi:Tfp pilus assembly protein PilV